jgi:galactitol-specific phosphotransferase system IIC component
MVAMSDVLAVHQELLLDVLLTLWCLLMDVPVNRCLELGMMVGISVCLIVVIMVHNVPTKVGPYL